MTKIRKYQTEKSSWTIDLVIEQNINVSKYQPLNDSSYIILPKYLSHSIEGLINTQNTDDNKC